MVILSRSVDALMRAALAPTGDDGEEGPAECVSRLLMEAESDLEDRLKVVRAAQARVLWSACFAHGVEMPE